MNIEKMWTNPRLLRAATSLNRSELEQLVFPFEQEWLQAQRRSLTQRGTRRVRALGAGRKGQLGGIRHKLLFILMYFKLYPLQEVMGLLFGFHQSEVNRWVHRLTPVLEKTLGFEAGAGGVSELGICVGRGGTSGAPPPGPRPTKAPLQRKKEAARRQELGRHPRGQDPGIEPDGSRQRA